MKSSTKPIGSATLETALVRAFIWILPGAAAGAASGLVTTASGRPAPLAMATIHLTGLVIYGLAVAWDLRRLLAGGWFDRLRPVGSRIASAAMVVALTTGVVALVTLASAAALRFDPSLQFLLLLSALDIAWVTSTIMIGVTWLSRPTVGSAAAGIVAVMCVMSIWTYLDHVGFGPGGGWLVDASALSRYVLPFDAASAVLAVAVLVPGARKVARVGATTVAR